MYSITFQKIFIILMNNSPSLISNDSKHFFKMNTIVR